MIRSTERAQISFAGSGAAAPRHGGQLTVVPPATPEPLVASDDAWDRALIELGGHLLQSWRWGEFKARQGWGGRRLRGDTADGVWMAQLLFKHVGPFSVAYMPCGPSLGGDHARSFRR